MRLASSQFLAKEILRCQELLKDPNVIGTEPPEITGWFHFQSYVSGQLIEKAYHVRITFPNDYPNSWPEVAEISGMIPRTFHRNSGYDAPLCLGANIDILRIFSKDRTIDNFILRILTPYLAAYAYFKEYGALPHGERSHGSEGVLESYRELFPCASVQGIIEYIKWSQEYKTYRGHLTCPCSNKHRLRKCREQNCEFFQSMGLLQSMDQQKSKEDIYQLSLSLRET